MENPANMKPKQVKRRSVFAGNKGCRRRTGLFNSSTLDKASLKIVTRTTAGEENHDSGVFDETYTIQGPSVGKGSFGSVWRAFREASEVPYAVKEVDKEKLSPEDVQDLKKEVLALKSLEHPNIIEYFGHYDEPNRCLIVMEFVAGGTLQNLLKENDPASLSEHNIKKYIVQIAEALLHCKEMGVVHRDIKPGNVMVSIDVNGEPLAKLIDFGFGAIVDLQVNQVDDKTLDKWCGTLYYASPEIMLKKAYNYKTDFWSLGVMLFQLLSRGVRPFKFNRHDPDGKRDMVSRIAYGYYSFKPKNKWQGISNDAKDMVRHLLTVESDQRFGPEDMLSHPWINNEDFEGDETSSIVSYSVPKSSITQRHHSIVRNIHTEADDVTKSALSKLNTAVVFQKALNKLAMFMNEGSEEEKNRESIRRKSGYSAVQEDVDLSSNSTAPLPAFREHFPSGVEGMEYFNI